MALDLLTNRIRWSRAYGTGIDSFAVTPNGRTIYLPDGGALARPELARDRCAHRNANRCGRRGGRPAQHRRGARRPLRLPRRAWLVYLTVVSTKTNRSVRQIGPLRDTVRPFTINGRQTIAYTTATGFLGFQMNNITAGDVRFTVPIPGSPMTLRHSRRARRATASACHRTSASCASSTRRTATFTCST